jgi:hypothetical protein
MARDLVHNTKEVAMKHAAIWGAVCLMAGMGATARAQDGNTQWLGVWQSQLDGQTGAIVTLADDTGQLGGTIVLNMIRSEAGPARVIASETHFLLSPRLNDQTLTFEVKPSRAPHTTMDFTMVLKPNGTATIHCTSCNGAPVVELTKEW